ncbi:MAG: triose-phosphate isomerase [Alphaproteobacteria bacterium]|nr:triose-phosphate isomerase [Alphaproteobacteria bacterium]
MKKLIAGNWKMNGSVEMTQDLLSEINSEIDGDLLDKCGFLVFPPALYVTEAFKNAGTYIDVGVQDCSHNESGAYTGEISAAMIKDCGASHVLLGHSERRQYHNETDELVCTKAKLAFDNGLIAVICIGETEEQRDNGKAFDVVEKQLAASVPESANAENTIIAYEPVWAIGTGKTASAADVAEMHSFIRGKLGERFSDSENFYILYGGSMKPENAGELLATPNVNGGLIGGASLKADQFLAIAKAAP